MPRPLFRAVALAAALAAVAAAEDVAVPVGADLQRLVDANPPGTRFGIAAGVHERQSVVPKRGDEFIGEPGAILDGGDAVEYAFLGDVPDPPADVRIVGLVIQRYASPLHFGAVRAGGHDRHAGAPGWTVEACEIRQNRHAAIRTADGMRVLRNRMHHNGWTGYIGTGDDVLIEGNEIAWNNPDALDDGGGGKIVAARGLVVRGNWSHHNRGPGMWTDINDIDALYEANVVEDNEQSGIFHEIGYRATIRGNFVARNGARAPWLFGAGILVSESRDVEVVGNVLVDNACAIIGKQQVRGERADYGPHELVNLWVHGNAVRMAAGWQGIGHDVPDGATYFTSRGNRFDDNAYAVGALARPFRWSDPDCDEARWRAFGNDVHGTVDRSASPPDLAAPIVAVTEPSTGDVVSGAVALSAIARDDIAVVGVRFLVDGAVVAERANEPYRATFDAGALPPGPHAVVAEARDAAGHATLSPAVLMTSQR